MLLALDCVNPHHLLPHPLVHLLEPRLSELQLVRRPHLRRAFDRPEPACVHPHNPDQLRWDAQRGKKKGDRFIL